eukprot:TRINITY_DN40593_c0_g1_i1.p1 TRINITY_DN40593_c0_g1~~TRINITY_DN40593_c0_g1_i1.p1  ORF type:complete len:317 (+),score=74.91 TRINITY_DN40593_c0_g1_i1:72-1022(+)
MDVSREERMSISVPFDLSWLATAQINRSALEIQAKRHSLRCRYAQPWTKEWSQRAKLCLEVYGDENWKHSGVFDLIVDGADTPSVCLPISAWEEIHGNDDDDHDDDDDQSKVILSSIKKCKLLSPFGLPSVVPPIQLENEIRKARDLGVTETLVFVDRDLLVLSKYEELYNTVCSLRSVCDEEPSKKMFLSLIFGRGELPTLRSVHRAALTVLMAGADSVGILEESSGPEKKNLLEVCIVIARAIKEFHELAPIERTPGFRCWREDAPKSLEDVLEMMVMVFDELGSSWLTPEQFRYGFVHSPDGMARLSQEWSPR